MGTQNNVSDDPEVWLRDLIRERWQPVVDELTEEGRDIALKQPPLVAGGSEVKSGSSPHGQLHIKVYQDEPEDPKLGSWNDRTRDTTVGYVIQAKYNGENARGAIRSADRIIDRILLLHRDHPHPDWQRFESWTTTQLEAFPDFQRIAVNLRMSSYGVLVPESIQRT